MSNSQEQTFNFRAMATSIKNTVNLFFTSGANALPESTLNEIKAMYCVLSYMDTFLTRCLKKGQLVNKYWILSRLLEVRCDLNNATHPTIKDTLSKLNQLAFAISLEETPRERKNYENRHSN